MYLKRLVEEEDSVGKEGIKKEVELYHEEYMEYYPSIAQRDSVELFVSFVNYYCKKFHSRYRIDLKESFMELLYNIHYYPIEDHIFDKAITEPYTKLFLKGFDNEMYGIYKILLIKEFNQTFECLIEMIADDEIELNKAIGLTIDKFNEVINNK